MKSIDVCRKTFFSICIAFLLTVIIIITSANIVSAASAQVWVSPDYHENTEGWGISRFSNIQDAVDAITEGGTVNILSGTYYESVSITKNLRLIGENSETTIIDAQDNNNCLLVNEVTDVTVSGLTLHRIGEWSPQNCTLRINISSGVTIQNNHILGTGISLGSSHNNLIENNEFDSNHSIMLFGSCNNHVIGNEIQAQFAHTISLLNRSCNNEFINNSLIGTDPNAPCTGFRLVYSPNNLVANNTIQNFRAHVLLTGSDDCIIADNDISISRDNQMVNQCGIILYRANNNVIINNNISSIIAAGIRLFGYSKENNLQSNIIEGAGLGGIELYYDSDDNKIENNKVTACSFGIILDDVSSNRIFNNNFADNEQNGYDDGDNTWESNGAGNYWNDHEDYGDTQYVIAPNGIDNSPLMNEIKVTAVEIPALKEASFAELTQPTIIDGKEIWEERIIELSNHIDIRGGASLTLRDVDIKVTNISVQDLFIVEPGGRLEISHSRIYSCGQQIQVNRGAFLEINDSELYGLGSWDGGGGIFLENNGAVVDNNIIQGGYSGICVSGSANHQITGNIISDCSAGITFEGGNPDGNHLIENNEISNIIGEGIFGGGLTNSLISGNTFKDIWGHPISLKPVGVGKNATGNIIYNNSFIECGPPWEEGFDNSWYMERTGNYWDDYQEKYPDAKEHAKYDGVWDTPYIIPGNNSQDLYPIMPSLLSTEPGETTDMSSQKPASTTMEEEHRPVLESPASPDTPAIPKTIPQEEATKSTGINTPLFLGIAAVAVGAGLLIWLLKRKKTS